MSITAIAVLAFVVVAFALVSAAVIWFAREDAVRYRRTHRSDPRGRGFLYEPTDEVLQWVSNPPDVYLNYVELALDWIFDDKVGRDEADELVARYHVKKYHRDPRIRFFKRTRYTDRRSAPNNFVMYGDKPCRTTGELYCLHLEWRMRRHQNLKRIGIVNVADLLKLDHRAFWEKRLLLATFDLRKLGRMHRNNVRGIPGRTWLTFFGRMPYDHDLRLGHLISFVTGSTQGALDEFAPKFRVRDCLIPLDVQHLLPDPNPPSLL
jgi:hypothetical protein